MRYNRRVHHFMPLPAFEYCTTYPFVDQERKLTFKYNTKGVAKFRVE
jgi:hypothetical protein